MIYVQTGRYSDAEPLLREAMEARCNTMLQVPLVWVG